MILLDNAGTGRGALRVRPPPRRLAWAVEHVWLQRPLHLARNDDARGALRTWRVLPDGSPHLIFTRRSGPGGEPIDRLALVGPRTRFADIDLSDRLFSVGVRLRAGVLPALTGEVALPLADTSLSAEDAFGPTARSLLATLQGTARASDVVDPLLALLDGRLRAASDDLRVRAAVSLVESHAGRVAAGGVAAWVGLAPRTLREIHAGAVGMGVKRYTRIRRMHEALSLALGPVRRSWARIAAEAGYSDQSHLIRDFHALVGESPTRFLARARPFAAADPSNPRA